MDRDMETELVEIEAGMVTGCWVELLNAWRDVYDSPDILPEAKRLSTWSVRKMSEVIIQMAADMNAMLEDARC